MTVQKNKFTGQERVTHKPILCDKCGMPGGIKGTQPLRKIKDGKYVHQKRCPMQGSFPFPKNVIGANIKLPTYEEIAKVEASKSPDERMA